jgi:hypothetical protein
MIDLSMFANTILTTTEFINKLAHKEIEIKTLTRKTNFRKTFDRHVKERGIKSWQK